MNEHIVKYLLDDALVYSNAKRFVTETRERLEFISNEPFGKYYVIWMGRLGKTIDSLNNIASEFPAAREIAQFFERARTSLEEKRLRGAKRESFLFVIDEQFISQGSFFLRTLANSIALS